MTTFVTLLVNGLWLVTIVHAFKILSLRQVRLTEPGFESVLTSKGIEFANKYATEKFTRFFNENTVYNWRSSSTSGSINMQNFRFDSVDDTNLQSNLALADNNFNGLIWKISGLSMGGSGLLTSTLSFMDQISNMQVTVNIVNLKVLLVIASRLHSGRLIGRQATCTIEFDKSELQLPTEIRSSNQELANAQLGVLIGSNLCDRFRRTLVPQVHDTIYNIPLNDHMYDVFYLNAQLIEPLEYGSNEIRGKHVGTIYTKQYQIGDNHLRDANELPFQPVPIDDAPTVRDKMVSYALSNYTIAGLLYWLDQLRQFDYVINKKTKAAGFDQYMLTECDDDLCAGGFFPGLRTMHPQSEVVINSITSTYPTVLIEDGEVKVITDSDVISYAYPLNEPQSTKRTQWLNAKMRLHSRLENLQLTDEHYLTGELKVLDYKLSDIKSPLKDVNPTTLDLIVSAIIDSVVKPDQKTKFGRGIRLPKILRFKGVNSKVAIEKNLLIIASDYCSTKMQFAPCSDVNIATEDDDDDSDYYEDDLLSRFDIDK